MEGKLEGYLNRFGGATKGATKGAGYTSVNSDDPDNNGDSVAINVKDDLEPSKGNHELELFWLSIRVVPVWDRWVFIGCLLVIQLISLLSTLSLLYHCKIGVNCAPLLLSIINLYFEDYKVSMMFRIKRMWKEWVLKFFTDLSLRDKKGTEDMTDFNKMVDRSSDSLHGIFTWGLPIVISGARQFITIFSILIFNGYWKIIISTTIIYGAYFCFYMMPKQKELVEIRAKMKKREKWVVGLLKWTLALFQRGKRDYHDILNIEDESNAIEISFYRGWDHISGGMTIISAIVSFIGLAPINDWSQFLFFKIIFDDLRGTIVTFSNFTNSYASRSKDFDKILAWYWSTDGRKDALPQEKIPENGLIYSSVNISHKDLRLTTKTNLTIKNGDVILLRGSTGAGKTSLINTLCGLTSGATLDKEVLPEQISNRFEYLDQGISEIVPNGQSISALILDQKNVTVTTEQPDAKLDRRKALINSIDVSVIMAVILILELGDKIKSPSDIDLEMTEYSGGQKMKFALLFIILEVIKYQMEVVVLDEPEKGFDPGSKRNVITKVLNFLKTDIKKYNGGVSVSVLMIYHGDDLDIVHMEDLLTKVWVFEKVDGVSTVTEDNNIKAYCDKIILDRDEEINRLKNRRN